MIYVTALASRECELQRFTVEYLRSDRNWHPTPNTNWKDYAVEAAAASAYEGLRHLKSLASESNTKAVERLADFALDTANTLAQLTQAQFATVKAFAQKQRHWPILKSLHQHFDSDHEAILGRLEVGNRNPLNIYTDYENLRCSHESLN
jgi:hypothetical protein